MKKKIQWMDSLRCFAFILILIYHFYTNRFPGGFLGVDLLFVLSGYLITSRVIDEVHRRRRFNRKKFYQKRILRIVPSVVLMVFVSSILLLFSNPDLRVDIGRQTAGVLGFVTNWYEILSGGSYETKFVPHVYVHNWSLAIEMHYYLVWGLILSMLVSSSRRGVRSRKDLPFDREQHSLIMGASLRKKIMWASIIGIIFFTLCQWYGLGKEYPISVLYFSDLSRAGSFFFGSLAASLAGLNFVPRSFLEKSKKRSGFVDLLILLVGGGLLVFFSFFFSYESLKTYFFGFLLTDIISMFMILSARSLHEKSPEGMEFSLIHWLSKYSYGLYLFHYPIYIIGKMKFSHTKAVILAVIFGLLLSVFSEKVWAPLWKDQENFSFKRNKFRKNFLKRALLIMAIFVIVVSLTAPSMLSLEKNLWAQSLNQDLDQAKLTMNKVENLSLDEKAREEREAAKVELEDQGITVIGDSVALGMRPYFLKDFENINVDGAVSRFLHHGDEVITQKAQDGSLKKNVVICLGNNVYPSFAKDARRIAEVLPKGKRLIFIAPYDKRVDESSDVEKYAKFLPSLEKEYPYVTVANWNAIAKAHPDYFSDTDGVHFYAKEKGIPSYINCVKDALAKALKKPVKQ